MEQVLPPEKFLAQEPPRTVRIRYARPDGRVLAEGGLGELFTRPFLAAGSEEDAPAVPAGTPPPPTGDEVERAAAGWGGDAYKTWDVGGKTLLVWRTEWDRREDAREFEQTVLRRLERTHGARKRLESAALFARAGWLMAVAASGDAAASGLGAFTGLAAWVLAAASLLTLTGAGAGWLRRTGTLTFALLPVAFVVNAVVWWLSLPPGALR